MDENNSEGEYEFKEEDDEDDGTADNNN